MDPILKAIGEIEEVLRFISSLGEGDITVRDGVWVVDIGDLLSHRQWLGWVKMIHLIRKVIDPNLRYEFLVSGVETSYENVDGVKITII